MRCAGVRGGGVMCEGMRGEELGLADERWKIHPGNDRTSGRYGSQYLAQCVGKHVLLDEQGTVLSLVV